jgi:hypothetical protein
MKGKTGLRAVTGLLTGVSDQIGREINLHVLREDEFKKRLQSRDHLEACRSKRTIVEYDYVGDAADDDELLAFVQELKSDVFCSV